MKRYPIGIQDFQKLRAGNYLYVDKTQLMYQLLKSGSHYFLSRPRRFGKSLLLSTLKYFFLGRRDLFDGLWVDREVEHDWAVHPVLHFSFSTLGYKDLGLHAALHQALELAAQSYGVTLTRKGLGQRLEELIHILGAGTRKVVLLIDEYDKPLTDYFDDIPQAQANREVMKNFFSVLKDADAYLRFFLITGVSKFSKVSLFSDLNNLNDLTRHPRYATLTGYTPAELDHYFGDEYPALAAANDMSSEAVQAEIQRWYNGYQWEIGQPVYNPFSVLQLFDAQRFANYWWETGTPTFLLKALKGDFQYDIKELEVGAQLFDSYTLEHMDWRNLLFQTGYLTIKSYLSEFDLYVMAYPNQEVESSLTNYLLAYYREGGAAESQAIYAGIKRALDAGDLAKLVDQIDRLFSTIPHQIFDARRKGSFTRFYTSLSRGWGLLTQSEVSTAQGRVDSVVRAQSGIYVMEFKLDAPASAALEQIREKRYGSPYLGQGLPVMAVGMRFSSETKTVVEWVSQPYEALLAEGGS